eukprot:scaffold257443_cov27-Tisochrysis_lutea.AAC.3
MLAASPGARLTHADCAFALQADRPRGRRDVTLTPLEAPVRHAPAASQAAIGSARRAAPLTPAC